MAQHEIKTCSRCSSVFECKAGSITQCQCFAVQLSNAERDFLAQQFTDCLCANCLNEIKKLLKKIE